MGAQLTEHRLGTIAGFGIAGGLAQPEVSAGGVEDASDIAKAIGVAGHAW